MNKYSIKKYNVDFKILDDDTITKGSRRKVKVIDISNNKEAYFKYEGEEYSVSESCSEKMSYEIAKVLGYECAKIELAKDENDTIGILNYFFNDEDHPHYDMMSFLNTFNDKEKYYATLTNILKILISLDKELINDFIKIMVFDSLIGETDRHAENWGITISNKEYKISPLYDNGCNLLREFRKEEKAQELENDLLDLDRYISRSKTHIYKDDNTKYNHFDLIRELKNKYPDIVQKELENLNKITNDIIYDIVNKIPDDLLTEKHKEYIIRYLIKRRNILIEI